MRLLPPRQGAPYGSLLLRRPSPRAIVWEVWTGMPCLPLWRSTIRRSKDIRRLSRSRSGQLALPALIQAVGSLPRAAPADVGRVRPPNNVEMRSNQDPSVWDCPPWDDHVIKLPKGREGNAQDREWVFGEFVALNYAGCGVDPFQIGSCPPHRTTRMPTGPPQELMSAVRSSLVCLSVNAMY